MKVIFVVLLLSVFTGCSSQRREPANDGLLYTIDALTQPPQEERPQDKYCRGNPPGSDDAWCSWVCIDGRWARVCR